MADEKDEASSHNGSSKESQTSKRTKRSVGESSFSSSETLIKQMEINFRKEQELARIEQEEAERDREIARQKAEREKNLVELKARLEEVMLTQEINRERRSRASVPSVGPSCRSNPSIISKCSSRVKVEKWLHKEKLLSDNKCVSDNYQGPKYCPGFPIPFTTISNKQDVNPPINQKPADVLKKEYLLEREVLSAPDKYMARQTLGRDLPEFNGNTASWVLFISMFRQTTEVCGFTDTENMLRLQKCLKGDALEAVRALLTTTNVEKVINILERRFGRADFIIEDLMNKVSGQSNVREDKPVTLINFSNAVTNLVATVESLNRPSYLVNPILLRQLVGKLPPSARIRWGKRIAYREDVVYLNEFASWIENEAAAASVIYQPTCDEKEKKDKRVLSIREENNSEKPQCIFCEKFHKSETCAGYQKLSIDDRWALAKRKKACYGCLSTKHAIRKCSRRACGKNGCKMKHHPSLHNEKMKKINNKPSELAQQESESDKVSDKTESDQVAQNVLSTRKSRKRVLLRVLPVTLKGPSGEIDTFAILDGGSTISLIDSKIADRLGLKGPVEPLIATWYNNESVKEDHSRLVSVEICGSSGKRYLLQDVQTTNALKLPEQSMQIDPEKWPHLKNLDIPDLDNAVPTIMIGEDNLHLKQIKRQVTGKNGLPYASLTPLGWMVHGPYDVGRVDKNYTLFIQKDEDIQLHNTLKEFWSTESFGVRPTEKILRSKEEQRARDILDQTIRRIGSRWEAGLLWKEDNCELPESRKAAEKRLLSIEQKMKRDPNFGEKYAANMQSYIEKGYARRLTEEEMNKKKNKVWYLPHFAAVNPQKPQKLRMVFDAASKSHGESLNDHLLKGPDLLNSLPGILFKFRERKVAIGGDVKEMFHQVRIIKKDRSSQRFLWRNKETKQIDTLEMNVMIFGAVCSPYTAHEVRNRNAQEFQKMYPDACEAVVSKHYMDDYYDSVDTVEEAIQRTKDVIHVHRQGGFEVRNWTSNSEEVLNSLDPAVLAPKGTSLVLTGENYTRVLGVRWSPETDSFLFVIDFPRIDKELSEGAKPPTKREVLKFLMSLFDPLGLLAILTIRAKMIMQDIWRLGTGWDEELPDDLKEKWFLWLKDIRDAQSIRIPRCYSGDLDQIRDIQLHIFADASTQAMSAVAYLRLEGDAGIRTVLVLGKTRVAPIKILTVPRLELQAAVMAVRMAPFISQEHDLTISRTVFWTDSRTVLAWIHSEARKYHPFVAARIAEILDSSSVSDWRWVPTKENTADDATRTTHQEQLKESSRWFHGPSFLSRPEEEWPVETKDESKINQDCLELKREFCFLTTTTPGLIDATRFSSWIKLLRATAWVQRFVNCCKKTIEKDDKVWELRFPEIQTAEYRILQQSQKESFPEEYRILESGRKLHKSSKIFNLTPVFANGLLRLHGRVEENKDIGQSALEPIILDGKNFITEMLIQRYHFRANHNGRERVINDLREKYWIIDIRAAVKRSWKKCLQCQERRAQPAVPRMAPLPTSRVQRNIRPFTNTGVDYFGPMLVAIGRRHEKRYGVLFTCLATRAVHLEIASSLTTDSTIMALRRMMARRGQPERIYSDNGTNLRGASEELRKAVKELDRNEILRETSSKGIEWHFIPPSSPHMGGCWERLIGAVKKSLSTTLKERIPKEEVLQTLMTEAEYSVNSRPLTYISDDPDDDRCLTPNDFLQITPGGSQLNHGPPGVFSEGDMLRKQWRQSQFLADQFWRRWIKEYLPTINLRSKWHQEQRNIEVNEVVIIWDDNAPRNQWKKGRVTAVYPGKDGRVRVADIKTATGTLRRPVAKLCSLNVY